MFRPIALCILLVACEGIAGPDVPGRDAGQAEDAATVPDAGAATDGGEEIDAGGSDAGSEDLDAGPPSGPLSSRVAVITFNWPQRYGPTSGVDTPDRTLWGRLSSRASVIALQEGGWLAGYIRSEGWEVHRPNPGGDGDPQPVGNFLVWDPGAWREEARGAFMLSPETPIQPEAAGPTNHRPKYVVWARLRSRDDGTVWTFGSVHFVPSKHLGGAALALWELQRDSLLEWWSRQEVRTIVMGDFNAQPGDPPCAPFWEVARRQTAASHGDRHIDWIVRKRPLEGVRVEALDNLGQSDHRPVWGVVHWTR